MHTAQEIANVLDYAVLRPTATEEDIRLACELVRNNNIRTICVAPIYTRKAVALGAPVCAVVSFPHGISTLSQKRNEAVALIEESKTPIVAPATVKDALVIGRLVQLGIKRFGGMHP